MAMSAAPAAANAGLVPNSESWRSGVSRKARRKNARSPPIRPASFSGVRERFLGTASIGEHQAAVEDGPWSHGYAVAAARPGLVQGGPDRPQQLLGRVSAIGEGGHAEGEGNLQLPDGAADLLGARAHSVERRLGEDQAKDPAVVMAGHVASAHAAVQEGADRPQELFWKIGGV